MLSRLLPKEEYSEAMRLCDVIVESRPKTEDRMKLISVAFKGADRPIDNLETAQAAGFVPGIEGTSGIRIWRKPQD